MTARERKRRESRCKGRTKAGKPCRAAASEGGLCFFHANPEKASELGRMGGRNKCPAAGEDADPLPASDHATGLKDTLDRWIAEVRSGELRPRVAAALVQLVTLRQRVITADLERRVANLEKL